MGMEKVKGLLFRCDVDGCGHSDMFADAAAAKNGGWTYVETQKYKAWLCPSDGLAKNIGSTAAPGF